MSSEEIDSVVSAEIPDKETDPIGYEAVAQFMMHGLAGQPTLNAHAWSMESAQNSTQNHIQILQLWMKMVTLCIEGETQGGQWNTTKYNLTTGT